MLHCELPRRRAGRRVVAATAAALLLLLLLDLNAGPFGGDRGLAGGDLTLVEVVALRSSGFATTPRAATAPLAAIPSVPRGLRRPLAPVALPSSSLHCSGGGGDRGPPSSAPDFGCVVEASCGPCLPPPATFTGSLPSVCAFHASESVEPCDVSGAVVAAAVSTASTPTSRRAPSGLWVPVARQSSVSSAPGAACGGDAVVDVNGDDEDDENGTASGGDLLAWTSRRPFVRLRLLVILVIAFTVVGFVVLSPLFHCYM